MKRTRLGALLTVLVLLIALTVGTVAAQNPAYTTSFTTSITYQNVGAESASISLVFYGADGAASSPVDRGQLAAGAGTSLFVGGLDQVGPSFKGSAVLSSSQPVVATLVQVPQGSDTVKNRPLSNGFTGEQGAQRYLIATTLKNQFNSTTIFSVQNVGQTATDVIVRFFAVGSSDPIALPAETIQPGAARYFDLGNRPEITANNFNGSATIEAATGGRIVASAMELSTNGGGASSFEGVTQGGATFYMPSAICDAFNGQNSAYAVQNTGNSTANVRVRYSNGVIHEKTVAPGAKESFVGCQAPGMAGGFSGSAIVESTNGVPVVAIGKVYGTGLSTAFVGAPAGADRLALPYVRWSQTQYETGVRQRTFLAIQNVGAAPVTGVVVRYVDRNGTTVGTHTLGEIGAGAKVNSTPFDQAVAGNRDVLAEFGYDGANFGGGVIIEGPDGSQLVAIARVQSEVPGQGRVAEDYNGIVVQ